MGATSWRCYAAYQADPEAALQSRRAELFAQGEYVDLTGTLETVLRNQARRFGEDPDSPEVSARIANDLRVQQAVQTGNLEGLNRSDRALVKRLREFGQLAAQLGSPNAGFAARPRSIDELLEQAGECGTHSLLDIERVANQPEFAAAVPLTPAAIRKTFGSAEPTHDDVEQNWAEIAEQLKAWEARYFVVYRDGEPFEYAFIGCSGD